MSVSYDAKNTPTAYSYSSRGELTGIDHPAPLGDESFTYDALSRLATSVDGKGQTTTYTYDAMDRPTSVTTGSLQVGYGYDVAGNRTSETDPTGSDITAYDRLNRVTSEDRQASEDTTYAYDGLGNLTRLTPTGPGGPKTWTHEYNAANLAVATTDPAGNRVSYAYDADNLRTGTAFPGGTVQTASRDESGRATRISATNGTTVLTDLRYTYQAGTGDSALVQTRTDMVGTGAPAGATTTYTYDGKNRLTNATERTSAGAVNAAWAYTYDVNSNRTSQALTGATGTGTAPGTTSYTFNTADQLTARNGSTAGWAYDANGNETASPGSPAVGVPSRTNETNAFDQITATTTAGTRTPSTYSGSSNDQRLSSGDTAFTPSVLGVVGTAVTNGGVSTYTRDSQGQLVSMTAPNGATQYYLTDNLGSVIALVDGAGTKTAAYAYDPYGSTRTITGTGGATTTAALAVANANPYRYTGGYRDADTGLYKLGHRYYDTTQGRFTQQDPSGQEANAYLYAAGDPANNLDPNGLSVRALISTVWDAIDGSASILSIASLAVAAINGDTREVARLLTGEALAAVAYVICVGVATGGAAVTAGASLGLIVGCGAIGLGVGIGVDAATGG